MTGGPLGTTQSTYDAANNLLSYTGARGHTTAMTYSAEGDLLTVTDPTQVTTTWGDLIARGAFRARSHYT